MSLTSIALYRHITTLFRTLWLKQHTIAYMIHTSSLVIKGQSVFLTSFYTPSSTGSYSIQSSSTAIRAHLIISSFSNISYSIEDHLISPASFLPSSHNISFISLESPYLKQALAGTF